MSDVLHCTANRRSEPPFKGVLGQGTVPSPAYSLVDSLKTVA